VANIAKQVASCWSLRLSIRRSKILLHIRLLASNCLSRSARAAADSLLLWSLLVVIESGSEPKSCLGSSDSRSARSEDGLSICPAIEAAKVIAAVNTNEAITYEDISL
jgi:hypothetical protein